MPRSVSLSSSPKTETVGPHFGRHWTKGRSASYDETSLSLLLAVSSQKSMDSAYPVNTHPRNVNNMSAVNTARQSSDPISPELQAFSPRSRSCVHCRSKKIKCDRQIPCIGCVRSGSSCKYPAGPGRAPKRPREAADSRVFDRLSRLELLMKQMRDDRNPEITQRAVSMQQRPESSQAGLVLDDEQSSVDQQLGRLIIDDTRSCYVSNKLWANLTSEVCYHIGKHGVHQNLF